MVKLIDVINKSTELLKSRDIQNSRFDAETLIAFSLKMKRLDLYLKFDMPLDEKDLELIRNCVLKRANRTPLQYITGSAGFMDFELHVEPGVLIPRPETEILVEKSSVWLNNALTNKDMDFSDNPEILDLCTGACPIGISLAKSFESAQVSCTDISESALRISRINISRHNISNISLFKGNLDSEINPEKKFHLITANPPYIPSSEIEGLMPEVKRFEPVTALDGGPGGYDFYTPLSCIAEKRLFKNGRIYMETGWNQAQKVAEIFKKRGFETGIIKDYSNIERHVFAEKK